MVEKAQVALALAGHPPVVQGAEGEHDEHTAGEDRHTDGMVETARIAQPQDNPGHGQGEHDARQVGDGVEYLFGGAAADIHRGDGRRSELARKVLFYSLILLIFCYL